VSYGIIQEHGGEIHVESEPGRFTRFVIYLPAPESGPTRHSENSNDSRQQATNNQPGQNSHR
jgi:nitrogen-specific signal transduction histidine kinase